MVRWLLPVPALLFVAFGALTVVRSPDWSPTWKLALAAGEFGHIFALGPVLLAVVAWWLHPRAPLPAVVTLLLCALAFGLLTSPLLEAAKLARALPAQLTRQFGPVDLGRPAFAVSALFAPAPAPAQVTTHRFAEGLDLDLYRPPRATPGQVFPCIMVVHGGGWDGGARDELAHVNHWLAGCGYVVAAIDYRLAPQHPWPAQRADLAAALAYLQAHAKELGLDPTRFVLCGRSAGGNLAEAFAYTAALPAIRGVIALYAPADLHFAWQYSRDDDVLKSPLLLRQFLGGTPATAPAAYDGASGYLHVSPATPPTLLIHGQLDTLVWHRQSERLAARLQEHGVRHQFVSLPWATHACEYNLHGPAGQLTRYSVEWFLAAALR